MESINVIIIGLGHHAKRIYLDFKDNIGDVRLVGIVDLQSKEGDILGFLEQNGIEVATLFVENEEIGDQICSTDMKALDDFIRKTSCNAVIISTEPLSHLKYVLWALKNKLHILLDKPITTEVNVSTNVSKARKLFKDYNRIERAYMRVLKRKNVVFMLQAQRRFHDGFKLVKDKMQEMYSVTNCPITSIQSLHSDGQWRLPDEIVDIDYHSYHQNYGKMSHSGYHSLDVAIWMCELGLDRKKKYSSFEVYSKFSRPYDFLNQIDGQDYLKVFPEATFRNDADTYRRKLNIEGEIDAFSSISLCNSRGALITHLSCSMIHNGFSQRGWYEPNLENLYKGNGRVRHESYIIEQGPFQCAIINSFQSQEVLKGESSSDTGGENHFDIHIFRNSSLFPEMKAYELFQIKDVGVPTRKPYSRGHNENARRRCIGEFIDSIKEGCGPGAQKSNLFEHRLSAQLLSAIYESGSKDLRGKNSVVRSKI